MTKVALSTDSPVEFRRKECRFGVNARMVGACSVVELKNTVNGRHCDTVPLNIYGNVEFVMLPVGKHDVSFEGWISTTLDTGPVPAPVASSNEAISVVPAARGKNVTAAPVPVFEFHAVLATGMDSEFVELIGTIVNERGSADGGSPPPKETLKVPHCLTAEKEILVNARTSCGP
jgi:hypothetical protein